MRRVTVALAVPTVAMAAVLLGAPSASAARGTEPPQQVSQVMHPPKCC